MLKEFRDFIMRGNLVELAVAFVLGLAFAALINSFVGDLIMPIVAMIIGKPDFSNLTFSINDAVFRYGAFITAAITFVATAAALFFFVVKPMDAIKSRMAKPTETEVTDEERRHQELLARTGTHRALTEPRPGDITRGRVRPPPRTSACRCARGRPSGLRERQDPVRSHDMRTRSSPVWASPFQGRSMQRALRAPCRARGRRRATPGRCRA